MNPGMPDNLRKAADEQMRKLTAPAIMLTATMKPTKGEDCAFPCPNGCAADIEVNGEWPEGASHGKSFLTCCGCGHKWPEMLLRIDFGAGEQSQDRFRAIAKGPRTTFSIGRHVGA